MQNLFICFLIVNIVVFAVAGYDKYLAVNNKFRIPEKTLFTLAVCGGSVGLLLAMLIFRHKISKGSFLLKFFGILVLQILFFVSGVFYTKDLDLTGFKNLLGL
ncbi:uncharacterized membrane protein YsdA (DUF1294 family) [Flavobacterium arsenatis]|uniref:Uncharacterized membrane protein YsdA (DUF1294 family) n=1 Tax=Flavobacterium arsenatis TaxID=1484332 RepID=A0ABU1TUC5_9FLAO|nr:DUF1294 domain-containing protein [Flavobacterium arsenatis]MDR6969481.1 uncharacterized membrane protein YsdA (DUF1294 family) [Flavobacterium arsenatis]